VLSLIEKYYGDGTTVRRRGRKNIEVVKALFCEINQFPEMRVPTRRIRVDLMGNYGSKYRKAPQATIGSLLFKAAAASLIHLPHLREVLLGTT
jgi:hypothetical protein